MNLFFTKNAKRNIKFTKTNLLLRFLQFLLNFLHLLINFQELRIHVRFDSIASIRLVLFHRVHDQLHVFHKIR